MPESLTSTNGIIYPLIDYQPMFGKVDKNTVLNNVHKALRASDLQFEVKEGGMVILSAMGDDLPIGMMIIADDDNRTLNIYCYLMFDIPEDARAKLIPELNTINNSINNGGFYMDDSEPKIYFKIAPYERQITIALMVVLLAVTYFGWLSALVRVIVRALFALVGMKGFLI